MALWGAAQSLAKREEIETPPTFLVAVLHVEVYTADWLGAGTGEKIRVATQSSNTAEASVV